MPRAKSEEKEAHQHSWFTGSDESHQLCSCGCVLVSGIEWKRRKQEWDDYYVKVRESVSYKRFVVQKDAYLQKDMATVKKLAEEAARPRTAWEIRNAQEAKEAYARNSI